MFPFLPSARQSSNVSHPGLPHRTGQSSFLPDPLSMLFRESFSTRPVPMVINSLSTCSATGSTVDQLHHPQVL